MGRLLKQILSLQKQVLTVMADSSPRRRAASLAAASLAASVALQVACPATARFTEC